MELVALSSELVCSVQVAELASWYRSQRATTFCSNLACCSNCLSTSPNDTSVARKVALYFTSGTFETTFSASFVKEARGLGVIITFSKMHGWMGLDELANNCVSGFQNSSLSHSEKSLLRPLQTTISHDLKIPSSDHFE
ncbi:hypothetical protein PVL29_015748 [Vitis rotundifolia]|uniref:Uncharacterized protein n=1 Tax=Vitis rotundifolia TaxID=103349 RepID=A0AA39DJV8_VITRO|nr:hypothetical protein PVL29_015748 [Vitis rotundifolia]